MTDAISRSAAIDIINEERRFIESLRETVFDNEDRAHNTGELGCAIRLARKIKELPALDAVPVVRCKECVCCSRWNDQLVCSRISEVMNGYYHGTVDVVKPDDYCSHGMRKKAKPLDAKMGSE